MGGVLIFDVGANKGQSIKFFKSLNPLASIHSFEPSPSTFRKLESNLENQSYENVYLHKLGLSSSKNKIPFYESVLDETSSFELPNLDSQ